MVRKRKIRMPKSSLNLSTERVLQSRGPKLIKAVTLNIDDFGKTVRALKMQFYEKEGIEVQYQSLVYAGKPLRDGENETRNLLTS